MCGICGIVLEASLEIQRDTLAGMTDAMLHRGPDDDGYFIDGNVGLGFRRLSIVDLEHGHQPMSNEDGSVWVVFNGEIYNHAALRSALIARGHQFRTEADTEVIVHLFEEEGIDCIQSLRGMFAIAIYDARTREVYLARDFFGIKPLYYASSGSSLLFASELRSLMAGLQQGFSVNMQAVWDYLTFQYVPGALSMVSGIKKLPPAHYLKYKNGAMSIRAYWTPAFNPDHGKPLAYFVEGIRDRLDQSVQRHLQGSVPIGAFLSSGVDSSVIAALTSKRQELMTFSIGFRGARQSLDELTHADETAALLGTHHQTVVLGAEDFMERLPQVISSLEEPLGDPSALALYFVAELASRYVTVILSGEGADEIFGGYPIYHEPKSLRIFEYIPRPLKTLLLRLATGLPYGARGRSFLLRGSTPLERRFLGNIRVFSEDAKAHLLDSAYVQGCQASYDVTDPIYTRTRGLDPITRMQLLDLHTWLPGDILFKADKMTMAHSLELRVPFLDRDVFDFAATIPVHYRVKREGKYALRQAAQALLPSEVARRPKLGFPVPYREWLHDYAAEMWDIYQSSGAKTWFRAGAIEKMITDHRNETRDHGRELWTLLTFLTWHRVFMESSAIPKSIPSPSLKERRSRLAQSNHGTDLRYDENRGTV